MGRLARTAITGAPADLLASGTAAAGTIRCNGEVIDHGAREGVLGLVVRPRRDPPDERYGSTCICERAGGSHRAVRAGSDGQLPRIEERL